MSRATALSEAGAYCTKVNRDDAMYDGRSSSKSNVHFQDYISKTDLESHVAHLIPSPWA